MQAASGLQVQLRAPCAPALRARASARVPRSLPAAPRASYAPALRPYTIRKGDTLDSIAKKRGLTLKDLTQYNKTLTEKTKVEPGQTILLPTFKLSDRDREILKGIAPTGPRSYPLRKGETVTEVLKGRGVTLAEAQALNAGIDLAKVKDGQVIKLPYGRYTQREKEVLSSVVPATSLGLSGVAVPSTAQLQVGAFLALAIAAYSFYLKKAQDWAEKDV